MYCAVCATDAINQFVRSDPRPGDIPHFTPVALGSVARLADGSWQVPIARAVHNGDSVCMFHVVMPTESKP